MIKKLLIFLLLIIAPFIVYAYPTGDVNGDIDSNGNRYERILWGTLYW